MIPDIFAIPGMAAVGAVVLVIEVASLAALVTMLVMYKRAGSHQAALIRSLLDEPPSRALARNMKPGMFVPVLYVVVVLAITIVSLAIFLFQPHLL